MLEIRNISKTYRGGKVAVDNLSLSVNSGDLFGFIGHNGAGKTTTIKSVVGIMDFDNGEITIDGNSVVKNPVGCKQITAYIPDNPDLYEHLTGIQFIEFIADMYSVPRKERKDRIKKYADAFEITSNLGNVISSYSHGMKQKIAVIAAFIHQPKLLVLDEPFVGLDPKAAHVLKGFMSELCENGGAIFFSTHVLDVAEKICNKVAIIKDGKLIASGTMQEVRGNESLESAFLELTEDEK